MAELKKFSYEQLDEETSEFLQRKESNMREIVGKAYTELGRELNEAQQELRRQGSPEGVFMEWYQSLGFKKDNVSRWINRYKLFAKCEEPTQQLIEELPVTLSYEIAKPSAESTPEKAQAKAEVLSGEIDTLKAYKGRIKELEQAKEMAEQQAEAERKERERLEAQEPEVRTEYKTEFVEVPPSDYEDLRRENESLRSKFGQGVRKVDERQREVFYQEFAEDLDYIRKKYGSIVFDSEKLQAYGERNRDYAVKVNSFDDFWKQYVGAVLSGTQTIIDMEAN